MGAQAADSHWDRQPIHGDDFLKSSPTKVTLGSVATPVGFHLGPLTEVASRSASPQRFQLGSLPPLKPSQTLKHEGFLQVSWSHSGLEYLQCLCLCATACSLAAGVRTETSFDSGGAALRKVVTVNGLSIQVNASSFRAPKCSVAQDISEGVTTEPDFDFGGHALQEVVRPAI